MKKLSLYIFLVLMFCNLSLSEDSKKDFEIKGIPLGSSLLEYMSEEEIKQSLVLVYPGEEKFALSVYKKSYGMYDMGIGIEYRLKDKTYKIHGVQARMSFKNNIEDCYIKQNEIDEFFSQLIEISKGKIKKSGIRPYVNESTVIQTQFHFDNGVIISTSCMNFLHKPELNHLKISKTSKLLQEFLIKNTPQTQ